MDAEINRNLAIDFAIFATSKAWYNEDSGLWELWEGDSDPFRFSSEELYEKFIEECNEDID